MSNAPIPGATRDRQGSRILVIGCGFIGSHIVEDLAASGRAPIVLTRSRPAETIAGLVDADDLHLAEAQVPGVLEQALAGVGHVIYSAGGLLPAASEKDPERDAELTLGPIRAVLDALRSRPEISLTYLSSGGTVYGEPGQMPVGEDAATGAFGAYGRLHLACENEVIREAKQRGLRARILRCSTVYGEYQQPDRGQGALVTFLHRIEKGLPVQLYGDGTTIRDYIYAGDISRVAIELADRDDGPAILNLGSGEGTSLVELLRLTEKEVGRAAEVIRLPERSFEVKAIVLDVSRLRELIPFAPTPLEIGIARTHEWLAASPPECV